MSHVDPDETYLTVAEVAETLKLNQQTVRNWIDQGTLPALRVGRRVRIKRSDFERILEESYSGGASSSRRTGPSADDFWGGEPVGVAEPGPGGQDAEPSQESPSGRQPEGMPGGSGAEGGR
ncbi:MAG TPA: helix-turn-helix domain-containing protein [Solirubrobacteraceae bacterium]|nr:helix-turn-helix domain-containing protein [Solirubrobacteraceae bacterium]